MTESRDPLFSLIKIFGSVQNLNKTSEARSGLTLVQWLFLDVLADHPASSPLFLSQTLSVHPSTLTQTMKRLEKKKLIFITEDPKDSRKKIVVLTRSGKNAIDRAEHFVHAWSKSLGKIRGELNSLLAALEKL